MTRTAFWYEISPETIIKRVIYAFCHAKGQKYAKTMGIDFS